MEIKLKFVLDNLLLMLVVGLIKLGKRPEARLDLVFGIFGVILISSLIASFFFSFFFNNKSSFHRLYHLDLNGEPYQALSFVTLFHMTSIILGKSHTKVVEVALVISLKILRLILKPCDSCLHLHVIGSPWRPSFSIPLHVLTKFYFPKLRPNSKHKSCSQSFPFMSLSLERTHGSCTRRFHWFPYDILSHCSPLLPLAASPSCASHFL